MEKDVLLSIKGLQFEGDMDSEKIETITFGEYYKRDDSHYIIYDEVAEGGTNPIKTIIKLKGRELNLTKRGAVNTHMVFEEHKKNMSSYKTPFGDILVGIDTRHIGLKEQDERIVIKVDYALEMNYQFISDCTITMDIRAKSAGSGFSLSAGSDS